MRIAVLFLPQCVVHITIREYVSAKGFLLDLPDSEEHNQHVD